MRASYAPNDASNTRVWAILCTKKLPGAYYSRLWGDSWARKRPGSYCSKPLGLLPGGRASTQLSQHTRQKQVHAGVPVRHMLATLPLTHCSSPKQAVQKGVSGGEIDSVRPPHVRCTLTGRTCGEPNEIKKKYPPKAYYHSFAVLVTPVVAVLGVHGVPGVAR